VLWCAARHADAVVLLLAAALVVKCRCLEMGTA